MFAPIAVVLLTAGILGSSATIITEGTRDATPQERAVVTEAAPGKQSEQSVFLAE
jgi:hypothetical protein